MEDEQDNRQADLVEKLETGQEGGTCRSSGFGCRAGPGRVEHPAVEGAEFLMHLSQTLSAPPQESVTQSSPKGMTPLLERDEVSGRAFLKIPMPEPEAIQTLLSSLGALLGGLTGGQKN